MHAKFLEYSGLDCRLPAFERIWYELAKAGHGPNDVEIFLIWVTYENDQREPKYRRRFHIPRMFGDIAEFESDLSLARAWCRSLRQKPTARETALQDLRPSVDPELEKARLNPARSVREVLAQVLKNAAQP
jgi:hypothetical protein